MGELNCAIQSDCIGISSGAASVRPDEYARQTLGMSLHKDPSLFARCLVADRATRGPSCSPTIESFLWTSCLEPDVSYFQFDSLSPDDQKLAMQNQSIQAAHHKKKPEVGPAAAGGPYTLNFTASTGASASLEDLLFGDVYICGGQSNMQFSVGGNENASYYATEADQFPDIRLFTVGQKTSSKAPLKDLNTIEQNWTRAGSHSVIHSVDRWTPFNYFSAVCWFFGRNLYRGLGSKVPIGLVSNNWGGTRVEQWMTPQSSLPCGHAASGELYNAMIVPYTVGPMAVSGFTWYQGESDLGGNPAIPTDQNNNYTCTQTAMIELWREGFKVPEAFYAIVQLSTWYTTPALLAQLRDQQLASGQLVPGFAYATNADYGAGGNIHPPYKQHAGARLANAALAEVYGQPVNWRSPTYMSAVVTGFDPLIEADVTIWLRDVTPAGLLL